MPRIISGLSLEILVLLAKNPIPLEKIYTEFSKENKKKVYDTLFRLTKQDLLQLRNDLYSITESGKIELYTLSPKKDGVWKIVVFDIPETQRPVRNFLRAKLKSLGFKLWQNSIWISPFAIAPEIETEFNELAKHHFVRLIKTTDINYDKDLLELFK